MRNFFVSLGIMALLLPVLASAQENQPPVRGYCPNLYSDLQRGDRDSNTGGQVTELQKFLTDYYDLNYEDYVTGYFGRLTQQNVIRFQTEQGLPAFGYAGPRTRAAIARVCGGSSSASSGSSTPGVGYTLPPGNHLIAIVFSSTSASGTGEAPLDVTFTAPNVADADIGAYSVEFGDGQSGSLSGGGCLGRDNACSLPRAMHTYVNPGTYTAKLLKNPYVCTSARCPPPPPSFTWVTVGTATIVVSGAGTAQPAFTVSPTSGAAPLTVTATFNLGSSCTPYSISWGDGTNLAGGIPPADTSCAAVVIQGAKQSHTYTAPGTYTVVFQQGGSAAQAVTITVTGGSSGTPTFSASPTSGTAPLAVSFSAYGAKDGTYTINFGDGTSVPMQKGPMLGCPAGTHPGCGMYPLSASHTYQSAGTYAATLMVAGCSESRPAGTSCAAVVQNIGTVTITVTGNTASQNARIVFFSVKGESKVSPDSPVTLQFGTEHAARCDLLAVNNANASYMDQYNAGAYQTVAANIGIGGAFGTPQSYYIAYPSSLGRAEVSYVLKCTGSNGSVALGNVHVQVSGQSENGTISGRITMGPTCGAVPANGSADCADRPLETLVNVYKNGAFVKTAWSDMNGYYNTIVMAGTYELRAHEKSSSFYPRCNPVSATVTVGAHPIVNISCDTGIR